MHANVANHDFIRIFMALATSNKLILERVAVINAYFYGHLVLSMIIAQQNDSITSQLCLAMLVGSESEYIGQNRKKEKWGSLFDEFLRN